MSVESALRDLNNAVLDLQSADYNTYERPLERLSMALGSAEFSEVVSKLKEEVDFDVFLGQATEGGGMMGSARLKWPTETTKELGLVIHLIERSAKDPGWFLSLAHTYYYSGRKTVGDIRKITTAVIIPFNRDFSAYIRDLTPSMKDTNTQSRVTYNIGSMTNSPLQHIDIGAEGNQEISYATNDLNSIVALYRIHIEELDLDQKARKRADAQIATIEAQLLDEPDPTIVNAAGRSLKTIIEGAIGSAAGNAMSAATTWAPLLSAFS